MLLFSKSSSFFPPSLSLAFHIILMNHSERLHERTNESTTHISWCFVCCVGLLNAYDYTLFFLCFCVIASILYMHVRMFYRGCRCRDRRQHSKLVEIVISCYVKHESGINQYAATASAQIHFTKKRRGRHTQKDTQNIQISNVRFFNVRCARTSNFLNIANNINTTIKFSLFFSFFCFIQLVSSVPLYHIIFTVANA